MNDLAVGWTIKRNCSASPRQLALVYASIVAVSFAFGAAFAARGLWLVLPFVGLEVLAVAAAFLVYGRHAADYERIELRDGVVTVRRVEGTRSSEWGARSAWTRVESEAGRLYLAAHGTRIEVGRYLTHGRRAALAQELRQTLRTTAASGV
ncbi:MAG: DUF2244 domain-containing protein [Burkholderiales bacterium]|jgi:uncharacterized membrane protein|nr:DUF2244 domain-containing protein [Burkholderiales bacterium]